MRVKRLYFSLSDEEAVYLQKVLFQALRDCERAEGPLIAVEMEKRLEHILEELQQQVETMT